jgi:hypothetical protein
MLVNLLLALCSSILSYSIGRSKREAYVLFVKKWTSNQTLHFEDPLLGAIGMKKGCPQVEQLLT